MEDEVLLNKYIRLLKKMLEYEKRITKLEYTLDYLRMELYPKEQGHYVRTLRKELNQGPV